MLRSYVTLKTTVAVGTGFLILGFALFLQSLGRGGGVFALSLMLLGAVCIVISIVLAIVRVIRAINKKRMERNPSAP